MAAEGYSWRRLGAVLVEAVLLSEDDLAEVLVEQGRSGECWVSCWSRHRHQSRVVPAPSG
jgi:hypothetical protein